MLGARYHNHDGQTQRALWVTECSVPDAASMTAVPRPSRLALTAWVTPNTYTAPVPDDVSITVPTFPPKIRFPVLPQPHSCLGQHQLPREHADAMWGLMQQLPALQHKLQALYTMHSVLNSKDWQSGCLSYVTYHTSIDAGYEPSSISSIKRGQERPGQHPEFWRVALGVLMPVTVSPETPGLLPVKDPGRTHAKLSAPHQPAVSCAAELALHT